MTRGTGEPASLGGEDVLIPVTESSAESVDQRQACQARAPAVAGEASAYCREDPVGAPDQGQRQLAGDIDGTLPIVRQHRDFKNQIDELGVETISEIDIRGDNFRYARETVSSKL